MADSLTRGNRRARQNIYESPLSPRGTVRTPGQRAEPRLTRLHRGRRETRTAERAGESQETYRMAEPGATGSDPGELTNKTVQQMRKRLNWNSQASGRCTYTLAEGTLLLTSLVDEVVHSEAGSTGRALAEFMPLHPAILKAALEALSDVDWVLPGGIRLIPDNVTMLEMERQITDLVRVIDVRNSSIDESHRGDLLALQAKAKEHLTAVRARAGSMAMLGERLQKQVLDFEVKRTASAALEASLAELMKNREGNSNYKLEKRAMDGAVGLSKSEQGAALLKVRRISAEIDRTPDKASGDTHFGAHAFNDIARQFNALERALPASSPVKAVRAPTATPGSSGHTSAKTVADFVSARIAKSFTGLWGYGEIEWTHDARDFTKGLWLFAASSVWKYVEKMPGADMQTRLQLLSSCSLDSPLPVPEMLQSFMGEVNQPRLLSSIQDELREAANANMSCELKLKRLAGLLYFGDKVRSMEPVVNWAGEPADSYAWDSLQRLINGMDLANPQKDKLLEMSATIKSVGLTMAEVRNLCRTADISQAFNDKRRQLQMEEVGGNSGAHSFLNNMQAQAPTAGQLDTKNGSCSFCGIYGHDQSICRKRQRTLQDEKMRSSGLVPTANLGVWDPARLAALEAKVMETTRQQQELASRARALDASQAQRLSNGQQAAPLDQPAQQHQQPTDPRLQQAQTGLDAGAGYGGISQRNQYGGKGRFSPYRAKGKGKGKGSAAACLRCGSTDHQVATCQQPDKRTCYNCGNVGHLSWNCMAPARQQ